MELVLVDLLVEVEELVDDVDVERLVLDVDVLVELVELEVLLVDSEVEVDDEVELVDVVVAPQVWVIAVAKAFLAAVEDSIRQSAAMFSLNQIVSTISGKFGNSFSRA